MTRLLFLACAAFTVSACATQTDAKPDGRDCFLNSQISGYSVIDDHHIRVTVGPSRRYILTTNWNAHDLVWTEAVAVRSTTDWICTGDGLGVEVIGGRPRRQYPVNAIEREPEPAAAAKPQ
jgi:hypothetical protein